LARTSNESGVVDGYNFWGFEWLLRSETSEIRPAILYGDMLPLVGL